MKMNQMNDGCINVDYHDVVKCRQLCELCFMKRCFFVVINVDDSLLVMTC